MKHEVWQTIAKQVGHPLDRNQLAKLDLFRDWLTTEGVKAGGIGHEELDRLETRHIADSLLFALPLPPRVPEVWDLGTGIGLPGIPLAILMPETRFRLIDRSGRRIDLLKRLIRIMDLKNVKAEQRDFTSIDGPFPCVVSRATLSPVEMRGFIGDRLGPGQMVVQGGSWVERPTSEGWETLEISLDNLDQVVWLLIMRRQ